MSDLEKVYKDFNSRLWVTKGARFNAYRRLTRKQNASIFSISILTLYVLILSTLPANEATKSLIAPVSILASVFILILSLLEARKSYEVKADRLHNNAIALNALYSQWELAKNQSEKEKVINDYHSLIKSCPENHEPCDDLLFRSQHPHEFKLDKCEVIWIQAKNFIGTYWLYVVLVVSPGVLYFYSHFS